LLYWKNNGDQQAACKRGLSQFNGGMMKINNLLYNSQSQSATRGAGFMAITIQTIETIK